MVFMVDENKYVMVTFAEMNGAQVTYFTLAEISFFFRLKVIV